MKNLIPIEHKSQRVLTTQQIAEGYGTESVKIQQNFSNNKDRYIAGIHYFVLEGEELRKFKSELENFEVAPNVNRMFLWTEKGALLHAKSLNTDRAWEVYGQLVDTYFRQNNQIDISNLSPELQAFNKIFTAMAQQELQMKQLQGSVEAIKETIIQQPDNWREDINRKLNKIAQALGSQKYQEIRTESYRLLEQRAHVDLERRLNNYRGNLINAGASQTAIKKANKLDIIEQDPKLREIYSKIVSEYLIKYVA